MTPAEIRALLDRVPDGSYATTGITDGRTVFWRLERGRPGTKWAGWAFLSLQAGGDLRRIGSFRPDGSTTAIAAQSVLRDLAVDPANAATRYGRELGICSVCGRPLTDPESRAAGIGPVCAGKRGW